MPSFNRLALAAAVLAFLPLAAQEDSSNFDFKLHTGLTSGKVQKDHDDNKMFGFGLQYSLPLGGTRALTAELGYDVITAREIQPTSFSGPVYYEAQYGVPASITTVGSTGLPLYLSPDNSITINKESLEGFSLKVGYSDSLSRDWAWHAGLRLDDYQTRAEFTGTLIPMDPANNSPVPNNGITPTESGYYEGWAFQVKKTRPEPGAFAGLSVTVLENLRFELDLRTLGYQHYNYEPFTYTGQPAATTSSNRMGYCLEFTLAMNL